MIYQNIEYATNIKSEYYLFELKGQSLLDSNFWDMDSSRKGMFFLTANEGAVFLLIPDIQRVNIPEIQTGKYAIISVGRDKLLGVDTIEILFEDETAAPFYLTIQKKMTDQKLIGGKQKRPFIAYARDPLTNEVVKVLDTFCFIRDVEKLPCLKPWTKGGI